MDTVEYNLDSLGWYQFERLVQVLLKAEFGMGVESWGGRGDYGRDAFAHGPLKFPARDIQSEGPFVFQVKFVEGANVPGAKFEPRLMTAVRSEVTQIVKRIEKGQWHTPKHYALLTNVPVTPDLRSKYFLRLTAPSCVVWGCPRLLVGGRRTLQQPDRRASGNNPAGPRFAGTTGLDSRRSHLGSRRVLLMCSLS